ncbi:MAG: DUF1844 domain-containing protein [Candidatus Omnitrophica bacterium]|nr:DUF1844 domain-containing protein [Candidatus Omnitrophota bacterium]
MDKEVRFTQKKVDESWKNEVSREKGEPKKSEPTSKSSLNFSTFLTSLGYQTLMHLGEVPHPETQERYVDLQAAKETIDILILLEEKTRGNRTEEEEKILKTLLPDLQMKFVEKTSHS